MPKETNKKQENKKLNKDKKHFIKDFKAELKRVIWPAPKQLLNNTVAVITVVLITAAIVFVLDFAFESMNTYGIDKLKQIVDTTNTENINSTNQNNVNNTEIVNETNQNNKNETQNSVAEDSNSVEK